MMEEIWKPVPEYEKYYMVSNYGNVKRLNTGRYLSSRNGNLSVRLYGSDHLTPARCYQLPRLVYSVFVGQIPNDQKVKHFDHNPYNNRVDNLFLARKGAGVRKRPRIAQKQTLNIKETFHLPKNLNFTEACLFYIEWLDHHLPLWKETNISVWDMMAAPELQEWYQFIKKGHRHEKTEP